MEKFVQELQSLLDLESETKLAQKIRDYAFSLQPEQRLRLCIRLFRDPTLRIPLIYPSNRVLREQLRSDALAMGPEKWSEITGAPIDKALDEFRRWTKGKW